MNVPMDCTTRIQKLIYLISLIENRNAQTKKLLSRKLYVSKRTVSTWIEFLRTRENIPIKYDHSKRIYTIDDDSGSAIKRLSFLKPLYNG